jgi:hypothetical protein
MKVELQQLRLPIALVLKWRALADRKISYLADLQKSGRRWDCYYSEEQLASAIEDAMNTGGPSEFQCDRNDKLAPHLVL